MSKVGWGERIKARAYELGLTDAAVARALDLPQRRYSAYVNETREPDFATLSRICKALRTSPDVVLGFDPHTPLARDDTTAARLDAVLRGMSPSDQQRTLAVVEVLAAHPTAEGAIMAVRGPRRPNAVADGRRKGT